jgi:peptidoglycan hydrolase-like protein with peptidoglycan-binding domain
VVSVDGADPTTVDLYSDGPDKHQQKVWSTGTLASATHWVEIRWSANHGDSGRYINVDAFDVLGALPTPGSLTTTEVELAEQRLKDLSYRPGTVDGSYTSATRAAVIAFQKWEGLARDGVLGTQTWSRLQVASRPTPAHLPGATNPWLEVDKSKQVLLYCKNGAVVWTLHVSTGSASVGRVSPTGTWTIYDKTTGSPGGMYLPMYYDSSGSPELAIHGYPNVPTYPASHGCVRTETWDQDALYPLIPIGTKFYIYE